MKRGGGRGVMRQRAWTTLTNKKLPGAPVRLNPDSDNPVTRARLALGNISQLTLARKLGVSQAAVARWENGERQIPEMALNLIKFLKK